MYSKILKLLFFIYKIEKIAIKYIFENDSLYIIVSFKKIKTNLVIYLIFR